MSEIFKWLGLTNETAPWPISCPPGTKLDPTGKMCVPDLDAAKKQATAKLANLAKLLQQAGGGSGTPFKPTERVSFTEPAPDAQPSQDATAQPADKTPAVTMPVDSTPLTPVDKPTDTTPLDKAPTDKTVPTCAADEILVNGVCQKKLPPAVTKDETPEAPAKKSYWPWAIGAALIGGVVWLARSSAKEIGGGLKLNPRPWDHTPLTKAVAKSRFEEYVLPAIIQRYGPGDKVAVREAWNNWTDELHKAGRITTKQVNTWDNPY